VTVPRATRCNRRVAPGRLSPAAPSGRGHSDPAAGVWARRAPSRARTCAHRRARRPSSARARPRRHRRPPSASAAPLVLRRPRHRRRRAPEVLQIVSRSSLRRWPFPSSRDAGWHPRQPQPTTTGRSLPAGLPAVVVPRWPPAPCGRPLRASSCSLTLQSRRYPPRMPVQGSFR